MNFKILTNDNRLFLVLAIVQRRFRYGVHLTTLEPKVTLGNLRTVRTRIRASQIVLQILSIPILTTTI